MSAYTHEKSAFSDLKILGLAGAFGLTVGTLIHDGRAIYDASIAANLQSELANTGTLETLPRPEQILGTTSRNITASSRLTDACMEEIGLSALDYYSVNLKDSFTVSFRHTLQDEDAARMMSCLRAKQDEAEQSRFIKLG